MLHCRRRLALGLPLAAPERERISFVPHPLTVTAGGWCWWRRAYWSHHVHTTWLESEVMKPDMVCLTHLLRR